MRRVARAIGIPKSEILPALGARLGRSGSLATTTFRLLRLVPGRAARAAVFRSVSTPLVRRMRADLVVPVVEGSRMRVNTADVTGRMLATSGIWEPHVTAVFRQLLGPGDVCVDVGASIGYFTLLAARLVGPTGVVYALEPEPRNFTILAEHVALNGLANVTAERVAAGSHDGEELLYQPRPESNRTAWSMQRLPDDAEGTGGPPERVPVVALASHLPSSIRPRIRLVKIDVDGYEVEVLEGLDGLYGDGVAPHVVLEVHPEIRPEAPAAVAAFCRRHGLAAGLVVDDRDAERFEAARHPTVVPFDDVDDLMRTGELLFTVLLSPESG